MNTIDQKIDITIGQIDNAIAVAVEKEEYTSASNLKKISKTLKESTKPYFTEQDIQQLQNKVHKITGNGEVMGLFNELLGISAG